MINRLPHLLVPGLVALCMTCLLTAGLAETTPAATTPAPTAAPKSTTATTPTATATETKATEAKAAETPPVDESVTLSLGSLLQDIDGNERRFDQYVIPPSDIFLPWAQWRRYDVSGGPSFDVSVSDVDEPGGYADGWLNWGRVNAEARYRASSFYFDFEPTSEQSHRRDFRFDIYPKSSPSRRLTWRLAGNEVAWNGMPAVGAIDWRDRNQIASVGYRTSRYWLDAGFNREDFDVRTGSFLSGETSSFLLSFSPTVGRRTQVSGSFARHITDLDSFPTDVKASTAQLAVQRTLSPKWDVKGSLHYFNIDENIVQNAYADNQLQGRVDLEYRPGRRSRINGFWVGTSTDYVDGRHLAVVDTTSNLFGLRGSTRVGRYLKVTAGYRRQDNFDRPLSYNSDGTLANTLLWSDLDRWDATASYSPSAYWGLSADFQRRRWVNDAQTTGNTMNMLAITGWWQVVNNLMVTGSWLKQDFGAPFIDLATLRPFASDNTALVLAGNLTLSSHDVLYASYTHTDTSEFTDNLYDRFTIGATHDVSDRDRVLAEINFHEFTDNRVPVLDYDANLYRVEWEHKF